MWRRMRRLERLARERVPAEGEQGAVTRVVGDTFESVVRASDRDVLLQVYAPWCGHSKKLSSIYEALGATFERVPSVTIAQMDGTVNEVPGLEYEGYPSLFFFTASNRRYDVGDDVELTLRGLSDFVRAHAELPIDTAAAAATKEEL